jgi:ABC-type glycerol-3-phosphate transport system permease component
MTETTTGRADRPSTRRHGSRQAEVTRLLPNGILVAVLVAICAFIAIPLIYVVLSSLNSDLGVARGELIPSSWSLQNFADIWTTIGLGKGIANSLIVAGSAGIVSAAVALATAYVFVRFRFFGRVTMMRGLLVVQSVPGTLMVLPVFVVFASAGSYLGITVIGTLWGLFLTYLTFTLPFSTWVMVTYLRGLPKELEEAARIDGASNLMILLKVVLPLSWPGVMVSAIFAFLLGWNDVIFASVMTNSDTQTAAIALQVFGSTQQNGTLPLYGQMMAASLVCAAPVIALFLIFQRYLVSGLTSGAVKG